jgi:hypothetical protein
VDGVVTVVDGKAVAEGRFAADESAVQAQREADDAIDHETAAVRALRGPARLRRHDRPQ